MQMGSCRSSNEAFRAGATLLRASSGRLVPFLGSGVCAALLAFGPAIAIAADDAVIPVAAASVEASQPKRADFGNESPSRELRRIADWAVASGDNRGLPFALIDKTAARLYVFKPDGHLRGAAPVLLGIAKGDDSLPGIGDRPLSAIPPEARTTPAGRFAVSMGSNMHGKSVVWVDYDAAVSMHRVINTNPKEQRPHRLETPTPLDNRISYGCINVPIKFFDDVVEPSFQGGGGVVYILPEVHPIRSVFAAAFDGDAALHAKSDAGQKAPAPADARPGIAAPRMVHRVAAREDSLPAAPRLH